MQAIERRRRRQLCSELGDDEELDYVTLAKAGGRKDLLRHAAFVRTTDRPQSYTKVDWFDHPTPVPEEPRSPLPSSSLLQWVVCEADHTPRLRLPRLHRPRVKKPPMLAMHPKPKKQIKLPKVPRSSEPVNLTRLLSMDYQREWLDESHRKEEDQRRRIKAKRQAQKQKLVEHTMRARQIAGVGEPSEPKPRFIMQRFANVPSKLGLPRP